MNEVEPWTPEWKWQVLKQMQEEWSYCSKCKILTECRRKVVFGYGNPSADIMFVGEAPGEEEDKVGEPFVGRSGQLLMSFIKSLNLTREDFYFTNIVMCRPPENRDPTKEEKLNCLRRLEQEIYIVDPMMIVPVGKNAKEALMGGRGLAMHKARGKIGTVVIQGQQMPVTYDAMPIFHPAFILREEEPDVHGKWPAGGKAMQTFADIKHIHETVEFVKKEYELFRRRMNYA